VDPVTYGADESHARLIVDAALDAIIVSDPSGRILDWNQGATELCGWTAAEVVGRTMAETVLPPDRVGPYSETVAELCAPGAREQRVRREGKCRDREGRVFPVEVAIACCRVDGETTIVNFVRDLSREQAAADELRETNQLLRALLDASPLAINAIDLDGRTTVWNPAAERAFGWTAREALGEQLPVIPPEDVDVYEERRARVYGGEVITDEQARMLCRDGSRIDVSLSVAPIYGPDGRVSGSIAITIDITERLRAFDLLRKGDDERRRLLSRLVHAQEEERQRIAADIHDDSVQVLTALALRLGMLGRKTDDPATLESLAEAERTARLAITRLRHLMFELRPPVLDRDGLATALRMQMEQAKQSHGLDFVLDDELETEPDGDGRALVYRIAQEALVNVVKHAEASTVRVRLRSQGGSVLVTIADDGRGFDLTADPTRHFGLASMRERAEMTGGWCRVESAPGRGTVVEFLVPWDTSRSEAA
jgi:PAS domain S-box-containing protein